MRHSSLAVGALPNTAVPVEPAAAWFVHAAELDTLSAGLPLLRPCVMLLCAVTTVGAAFGSIVDFVAHVSQDVTVDAVNERFAEVADTGRLKGILRYTDEPIVSSDIVGSSYSSIFDSGLTMTHGREVKVFSWYDNEWGYSSRLVDLVQRLL